METPPFFVLESLEPISAQAVRGVSNATCFLHETCHIFDWQLPYKCDVLTYLILSDFRMLSAISVKNAR